MRKTTKKNKLERGFETMNKLIAKYMEAENSKGKVYGFIQFLVETEEQEEINLGKAFVDEATQWLCKQYDHLEVSYREDTNKEGKTYEYIGAYLPDDIEKDIARLFLTGRSTRKVLERLNINKYVN